MKIHPGVKPSIWGAAAGAVAISVVGFSGLGWTLGSSADRLAAQRADAAVVAALTPICVDRFNHQPDAAARLIEFRKISSSWDRRSSIEKGGWATMPGSEGSNSAVANACAEKLGTAS